VTHKTMEDAFYKGDAQTMARIYTADAERYVPGVPVLKGQSAIGRAWKADVGPGGNRLRIEVAEVEENGDRAHEVGRFTISAADGSVLSAAKYIVIWDRQPDGEWKTYRDIFNWDIPPRQP
jgi:ketosteroid isomerase-like protein